MALVVVPVSVKDRSGDLVTDLRQSDFRVFEDGIEQEISVFSEDGVPLSAAVVVDDDLKRSSADSVQKTLQAIGGGFSADDEVSLWRFDDVPQQISDFITDNDALITQLKRIDLNSQIQGVGSEPMTATLAARQHLSAAWAAGAERHSDRALQLQAHQRRHLCRRRAVARPSARAP